MSMDWLLCGRCHSDQEVACGIQRFWLGAPRLLARSSATIGSSWVVPVVDDCEPQVCVSAYLALRLSILVDLELTPFDTGIVPGL